MADPESASLDYVKDPLPEDVAALLGAHRGVITVSQARAAGISGDRIRRLRDSGKLTSLARGCYSDTSHVQTLCGWDRHKLEALAFAVACPSDVYLAGWSAVVTWGFPTVGNPPSLPTVVRPLASGRTPDNTHNGRSRVAKIPSVHLVPMGRWGVTSPHWTSVDLARDAPLHHALVVADHVARKGHDLASILPLMRRWQRVHRARWVVEHADGNAESPIETLGRFTCLEFDLPMPVSNAWVGGGKPERRVDGLLPYHHLALEADGGVKYNNRPDAAQIIRADRNREFQLRRLGLDFVRYGAPDVYGDRALLAERFRAAINDNPPREPIRWWKHVPGHGPVEPEPSDWPLPEPLGVILPADWERDYDRDSDQDSD